MGGVRGGGGGGGSFEIMWTDPRHERFLQDRSGPWEESTKTVVVHGRRAPRQEWSMGGEHQDSRTEGRRAEGPLHGFYCWFHNHILDRWLGYGFRRGN